MFLLAEMSSRASSSTRSSLLVGPSPSSGARNVTCSSLCSGMSPFLRVMSREALPSGSSVSPRPICGATVWFGWSSNLWAVLPLRRSGFALDTNYLPVPPSGATGSSLRLFLLLRRCSRPASPDAGPNAVLRAGSSFSCPGISSFLTSNTSPCGIGLYCPSLPYTVFNGSMIRAIANTLAATISRGTPAGTRRTYGAARSSIVGGFIPVSRLGMCLVFSPPSSAFRPSIPPPAVYSRPGLCSYRPAVFPAARVTAAVTYGQSWRPIRVAPIAFG